MSFVTSPHLLAPVSTGSLTYKDGLYFNTTSVNLPATKAVGDLVILQTTISLGPGGSFSYPSGLVFLAGFDWADDGAGGFLYRTRYDYKILTSGDVVASPWATGSGTTGIIVLYTTTGTTVTSKSNTAGLSTAGFTPSGSTKGALSFAASNAVSGTPTANNGFTVNFTGSNKHSSASNPSYVSGSVTWTIPTATEAVISLFEVT